MNPPTIVDSADAAELLRGFFADFGRGNLSAIERYVAPEIVYTVIGGHAATALAVPRSSRCRGHAGARRFVERLVAGIEVVGFGPPNFLAEDGAAAVFGRFTYRTRPAGRECSSDYAILVLQKRRRGGGLAGRLTLTTAHTT